MNTIAIIITALCSTSVVLSAMGITYSYKLNKERIKADASIKAEEIRARNQLEIEKLTLMRNEEIAGKRYAGKDIYGDEEPQKNLRKEKLR